MNKQTKISVILILLTLFLASCDFGIFIRDNSDGIDGIDDGDDDIPKIGGTLEAIITSGTIPSGVSSSSTVLVADTLGRVGADIGASIKAIYVTESGSGDYSGTSWNNAQRGSDLRTIINSINDASSSKVYVVLIGNGTYKPTTGSDVSLSFSMKNHTAIIGGFDDIGGGVGSWIRSTGSETSFDGELGTTVDRSDNTRTMFFHDTASGINHTAVLYGVEIRNGGNSISEGRYTVNDNGGGMYNKGVSPTLVEVTFISNYTIRDGLGGGMYNVESSPLIINSSFVFNESYRSGGGGMFNTFSSPIVVNTTFANNSAGNSGAIYNHNSSPTLVNVTMVDNNAAFSSSLAGGGVITFNNMEVRGSIWVNSIVWNNIAGSKPSQIRLDNKSANINLTLAGTVLQGNTNDITIGSTKPYTIVNDGVVATDPSLVSLTTFDNRYMPISAGSTAVDIGLHVKIDGRFANDGTATGAIIFYSENGNDWYTRITSNGLVDIATPPSSAVYLTKYDVTGRKRTGRPDAGAYEAR